MLIFNCTKAATDFFTLTKKGEKISAVQKPSDEFPKDADLDHEQLTDAEGNPLYPMQWVLHAVTIKRKHCLVAMEVRTRFVAIVTGLKKADFAGFMNAFIPQYISIIGGTATEAGVWLEEEWGEITAALMPSLADVHLVQRSDRSVQTQVNEVVRILRYEAEGDPGLLGDENAMLHYTVWANEMLRKSRALNKDSVFPMEEMIVYWCGQYLGKNTKEQEAVREKLKALRRAKAQQWREQFQEKISPLPQDPVPAAGGQNSAADSGGFILGNEAPSAEDLDFLSAMLRKYGSDFSLENVSALQGFLTALLSAPNLIPPSQWLPYIWGGEDEQPQWETVAEAERFIGVVFSMLNHLAAQLMAGTGQLSMSLTHKGELPVPDVADWCAGYTDAVDLDVEAWEALPDEIFQHVDTISNRAQIFADDQPVAETLQEAYAQIETVMQAVFKIHAYSLKQRTSGS